MTGKKLTPQATEALCRGLMQNIDLGITLIDRDHRIIQVNAALANFFDRPPESFIGKTCFQQFEKRDTICDHCPGVETMRTGQATILEAEGVRDDGSRFAVRIHAVPAIGPDDDANGFIAVVEVGTAQKQLEHQLQLTQFAVEHAATAAFWLHPDGSFFYVNKRSVQSLGYTREELLDMNVFDISPGMTPDLWTGHWQAVKSGEVTVFEAQHKRKDGTLLPVEIVANIVEFEGREYNTAFARDISEQKRAEAEHRHLEAQLQHAQKLESLGVLAGGIAHDFNNILMGVLGNAELARGKLPSDHPASKNILRVEAASLRAAQLANQMLAYSGKGKLVVKQIDINEAVSEIAHLLEASIAKTARLEQRFSDERPAIEADSTQIHQVVMNLITNASEALEGKQGTITLTTGVMYPDRGYLAQCLSEEPLEEGCYVYLEVSDTGCGIPASDIDKIFDPFFTTKFTGRGLGLAAVLGIMRGHHGTVHVTSRVGSGTAIRVLLPCKEAQPEPEPERSEEVAPSGPHDDGVTVLVVDDEKAVRSLAKSALGSCGYEVLIAADGHEAVEQFEQHADEIDIVVLDMTMPVMGGLEAFEQFKTIRTDVKVILSSGYNEQQAMIGFEHQRPAGFLHKPYRPSELIDKLRQVLAWQGEEGE